MPNDASSPPPLTDRITARIEREGLLEGIEHLLVACSGGGDSVALLYLLAPVARERGLGLGVCHLDHGLRGEASAADARSVREHAATLGLELIEEREALDPEEPGLEARARAARHAFFARACERAGADAVALGHTVEDQAETVLMNLARGAGPAGLAGMRARHRLGGLLLLRPVLAEHRAGLREFLRERGIGWSDDASNLDPRHTRNRFRHEVLPAIERIRPGGAERIAAAAAILRSEEDWLRDLAARTLDGLLVAPSPETDTGAAGASPERPLLCLDATALRALPRALGARVLREALARVRGSLRGISRDHVDAIFDAVLARQEAARDLPGVRVRLMRERLALVPLEGRSPRPETADPVHRDSC